MSYGGYNSYNNNNNGLPSGPRSYGSNNQNPFDDRNAAPGNVEMGPIGGGRGQSILQQCTEIANGVTAVERQVSQLSNLQRRLLDEADSSGESPTKSQVNAMTDDIMDQFRKLTMRVREVKSDPRAGDAVNRAQVGLIERRLKAANQGYQQSENEFRKRMQSQMERQFRIVRPDATEAEARAAVEGNNPQVFQQALMQGNRMGQANEVLSAVRQRHQEMQEVEQRLTELLNLMQDMQELLVKQEVTVMAIDQHAEEAAGDMVKANEELEVAVTTARKTRKKKWICLGICVTIVLIIVIAVVAYIMVNRAANGGGGGGGNNNNNNNNNNNDNNAATPAATPAATTTTGGQKRGIFGNSALENLQMNNARAVEISVEQPVVESKTVVTRSADIDTPLVGQVGSLTRRRLNRVRDMAVAPHQKADAAVVEKRFVVWEDLDNSSGSDE
ncbi:protein transport protein SSO2 [Cladorrhinum samala]|uniref:Protein transport protein SSO2 n=1 Tax=Cladorrhinum samala TaxID=585594 RepID=A0AAV9HIX3_9PEZI|nr:protein transport protein SSO2 [Cladorrhinum samala]